jgi:hypothetical protein
VFITEFLPQPFIAVPEGLGREHDLAPLMCMFWYQPGHLDQGGTGAGFLEPHASWSLKENLGTYQEHLVQRSLAVWLLPGVVVKA